MIDLDDFPSLEWWRAMQWFDDGDPSVVAKLILSGEPMSLHVREFVADIATGKRKPPSLGKARKVLTFDHRERLRTCAMLIRSMGNDVELSGLRASIKVKAIAQVVALSGASKGTVNQAWKVANSRWVKLDRKNKAFLNNVKQSQIRQSELNKLRELGQQNDPFKR